MKTAITVGSATIDVIATVANDDIERMTFHNSTASFLLMEPGRKVDATSVVTQTGGGAINAAISMARQGLDVGCLIKIGRDLNGEKIIERLQDEKIRTAHVCYDDHQSTAVSVMIAAHDRDAAIFTHRGANCFLSEDDIHPSIFTKIDLVYITNLSNESADRFPILVQTAKKAGAFIAVNPGIRQLSTRSEAFFSSLNAIDLLTLNLEEAKAFLPILAEQCQKNSGPAIEKQRDIRFPALSNGGFAMEMLDYVKCLHQIGPQYIAITDGGKGAYLSDGQHLQFCPSFKTKVKGTAGAGDAFASTLAAALINGMTMREAAVMGSRNASSVISHVDAQTGLLSRDALSSIL